MTRQPAAEKRFTVAWPMPRLAPVSSSARRGWFDCGVTMKSNPKTRAHAKAVCAAVEMETAARSRVASVAQGPSNGRESLISRIQPRLAPGCARCLAPELDAVVQPERPVLPELDRQRHEAVAGPVRRPRHGSDARIWPCRARSPSRTHAGFPAAPTACWPRRRSGRGAGGWRNRRRPRRPRPAPPARAGAPAG